MEFKLDDDFILEYTFENGMGISKYNNVSGTLLPTDCKILYEYAKKYNDGIYIETGSYCGLSSIIVGQSFNGLIYCHDVWYNDWDKLKGTYEPPKVDNIFIKFYTNILNNNLQKKIIPIRGSSHETLHIHKDQSIDLCFIDGDHSYNGVIHDLEILHNKIKPSGTILGHDCVLNSEVLEAVKSYCNKYNKTFSIFENSHGLFKIE